MTDPRVLAYLRKYGELYSESALRGGLIRAGYPPEEIDPAFAQWAAERQTVGAARPGSEVQPGVDRMPGSARPPDPYWRGVDWQGRNRAPEPGWTGSRVPPDDSTLEDVPAPVAFCVYIGILIVSWLAGLPEIAGIAMLSAFVIWPWAANTHRRRLARGIGWGVIVFPIIPAAIFALLLLILWGLCMTGNYHMRFG